MKRNIYSLLIGIGLVLSLPACKDFLNTEPSDAIPTDKVASDISLLPPALRGLYDELQGSNSSTAYYTPRRISCAILLQYELYQGLRPWHLVQGL